MKNQNNSNRDATHAEIQARYDADAHADAVVSAYRGATARAFRCACGRILQPQEGQSPVRAEGGYLDGQTMCRACAAEYALDA